MPQVISVNVGTPREADWAGIGRTAIEKHPVVGVVPVTRTGVVGDQVGDTKYHGGIDQAVYAFAREDLDWWEGELGRSIRNGQFAENLTTLGIDVNEAEVGEQWRVGPPLLGGALGRLPPHDLQNWQRLHRYDDRAWGERVAARRRPPPHPPGAGGGGG